MQKTHSYLKGLAETRARAAGSLQRLRQLRSEVQRKLKVANRLAQRYYEATAAYREALGLYPQFAEAWYGLGLTSIRLKRWDEAQTVAQALRELDPAQAINLSAKIDESLRNP